MAVAQPPRTPFSPPWWQPGGHLQTIAPALLRRVAAPPHSSHRLELADGDFLDYELYTGGKPKTEQTQLLILGHGLEGNSKRPYILGQVQLFLQEGWHVLAWNCRSCSGELNRLPRLYHHGAWPDLEAVVQHAHEGLGYEHLGLLGVSLGGALVLNYLADAQHVCPAIRSAVAISPPLDLAAAEVVLSKGFNLVYMLRFLRKLRKKLEGKNQQHPGLVDLRGYGKVRRFLEFDERYTAPLHGYASAQDYYQRASPGPKLKRISVPTLILAANNDPFYPASMYHSNLATSYVSLECTPQGGHCGFARQGSAFTYAEARSFTFLNDQAIARAKAHSLT